MNLRQPEDQSLAALWPAVEASIPMHPPVEVPRIIIAQAPCRPTVVDRIAALRMGEALTVYCVQTPNGMMRRAGFKSGATYSAQKKADERSAWIVERVA